MLNETLETQIEEVKRLEATGDRIALSRATSAFNTNMQKRKELYQLQDEKKCRLNKHSTKNIMNKSVGIILSSLGFSGLIVSLFIPPVGLTIMAASAIAGAAYFVFKITPPLVNWISHTFKTIFGGHAKENGHVDDQNHLEGPSLTETLEEEPVAPTLNVSNSANSITSEVAMPGTPGTDTAEIMTILAVQPGAHKPNPIPSALEDDEREELLTEGNTPPRNPSTTPIAVETETVPNRPENEAICPTSGPRNEE